MKLIRPKPKSYKGKISMLGNSRSSSSDDRDRLHETVYSIIEIGEHTLKKVGVSDLLDNYLHRALNHEGEVELMVLPGKESIASIRFYNTLFLFILGAWMYNSPGIMLGMFFGITLLLFFYVWFANMTKNVENTLYEVNFDGKSYKNT